jgi:hypothetical protein
MLDDIACTCDAAGCERVLTAEDCALVYRTSEGERRAYECACGAVTMTVSRSAADDPPLRR